MIDKFEPNPEQTRYPEYFIIGYRDLLNQGNLDESSIPFVGELKGVELSEDEEKRLQIVGRRILRAGENRGIGYLSSSSKHDRMKELNAASYIAQCFQEKDNPAQPLIVSIDSFYRFIPGNASLVRKTQIFDEIAQEQNPGQDFALILTDFSGSVIFTEEILGRVPTQDNAGMDIFHTTSFGNDLLKFAGGRLPLLIEEAKGDLSAVLQKITGSRDVLEEDAKLLLVTGLLLQDRQMWQNLLYEGRKRGTPLYIVAPMYFHDAMNRLNLGWGHGGTDYSYRASCSLGNESEPPLDDGVELKNYHDQGLSSEEFKRRIEPILNQFKK